jgi:hypothetical protein
VPAVLSNEADAYRFLEQLRWDGHPQRCPHCETPGRCSFLPPRDGRSRATRTGSRSPRRIWRCGACRRQFSVLTGTILAGSRLGLLTWLAAVAEVAADSSVLQRPAELADRLGLHPETARHLAARLRAAAEVDPVRSLLAAR